MMNRRKVIGNTIFTILMWAVAIVTVLPFVFMVVVSFRPAGLAYKPLFYVTKPILKNYIEVLGNVNFFHWYVNTVKTVIVTIVLRLLITIPAAYAFARLKFPGKRVLYLILMATMMIPSENTIISKYVLFKALGLLNTHWVIIFPEMSQVFHLLLMAEFFEQIPIDYVDAARIDGAREVSIMSRIFVPLSGPCIATCIIFTFIFVWNDYVDPFLYISSIDKQLITPALQFFQERGGADIPVQLAGASLAIIPIIIVFLVTQKYFIAGVTSSGIKG